ncbi:hypothetical protein SAMD00019534_018630 [Acytostelium subglobosum LB1]|uniref:hypothetical protein n=1 Tax=Acytostelium subglobosum LB1 TaxID=1410327 RepID=UPI000644F086|nr:hypothetical protein SAMD00019534_018630 [Acytostelium subglobosum LB1]GAM18688.1 hypothetical protein SAMD00019534_018630 [Acytostelium subglobosum LB1]|eukprot:XP_012757908.1 hypothetical protein SAMD00019534_018630 [Acytostelium subglobosum LB1]
MSSNTLSPVMLASPNAKNTSSSSLALASNNSSASNTTSSLLKIRPREVVYHPPFQGYKSFELKLHNQSEHILAYKVKTTAPIRYCVRPNTGIIPPGENIDIQNIPSISMKTKDKFQIQSTIVSELNTDPKLIWSTTPQTQIMKQRLKAVFSLSQNDSSSNSNSAIGGNTDSSVHKGVSSTTGSMLSVAGATDIDSGDEDKLYDTVHEHHQPEQSGHVPSSTTSSSNVTQPSSASSNTSSSISPRHSNTQPSSQTTGQDEDSSSQSWSGLLKKRNTPSVPNPPVIVSPATSSTDVFKDKKAPTMDTTPATTINNSSSGSTQQHSVSSSKSAPTVDHQHQQQQIAQGPMNNLSQTQMIIIVIAIALISFLIGKLL